MSLLFLFHESLPTFLCCAQEASESYLKDILGFEEEQLVSSDFTSDLRSSVVDAACTQVIDGSMVKIYSWYSNEIAYAARVVDIAAMVGKTA